MKKEDKISILQDVIKIPSVNNDEEKVADYLSQLFQKYGISSQKIKFSENRSNLVSEIGNGKGKTLGLSGHMDVVSAGDEKEWKYPPFSATIEGNKMYGRGSSDMKSGTVAIAIALIELIEERIELNGKVRFIATMGEEIGELGAAQLTKLGYANDLNALLIGEPTGYLLVYTHKGSINYTITSKGKAVHSSMPETGINALDPLISFYNKEKEELQKFADSATNKVLGKLTHSITIFNGGDQINSIPGYASLGGNIRTIPETPNEDVINKLKDIVGEINKTSQCEVTISIDQNKYPVDSDPNSQLIQIAKSVTKNLLNKNLDTLGVSGSTDGAEFIRANNKFDFVVYGPGAPVAHQTNEYVEIDNYLEMIEVYKEIIKEYLK